jgi:DNA replication protein DnaC
MSICEVCQERPSVSTVVLDSITGPVRLRTCQECQRDTTTARARTNPSTVVRDLFGARYEHATFDNFFGAEHPDFFDAYNKSVRVNERYTQAMCDNLSAVRNKVQRYAEEFAHSRDGRLLIEGESGTGKTHLAASAARVFADNAMSVGLVSAYSFVEQMLSARGDRFSEEKRTKQQVIGDLTKLDAVIIEDLNPEVLTETSPRYFSWLFMEMSKQGKVLIITSQISLDLLKNQRIKGRTGLGASAVDRLLSPPSGYISIPEDIPSFRFTLRRLQDHE